MCDQQYDVSPKMRELFEKKQKLRAASKEYWRKQLYNPYLPKEPFDPVLFRYGALSAYSVEHYKSSPRRKLVTFIVMIPFVISGLIISKTQAFREEKYRSGTVAYADRRAKLLV